MEVEERHTPEEEMWAKWCVAMVESGVEGATFVYEDNTGTHKIRVDLKRLPDDED